MTDPSGRVPPGAALDQLLDEIERFGREFERFMRSAASERKRGREDSEESLRNKANEQAQMIIARAKRLRAARDARPPQAPQDVSEVTEWLKGLRANALRVNDIGFGPEGKPLADRCTQALALIEQLQAADARPPQAPQEWHPIETVPQDRRWVLVWQEDCEYAVYRFGPGLIAEPDDIQWTHWQPLPHPPAADARRPGQE